MTSDELIIETTKKAKQLSSDDLNKFLMEITTISMMAIRGSHGSGFVKEFLTAVANDRTVIKFKPEISATH